MSKHKARANPMFLRAALTFVAIALTLTACGSSGGKSTPNASGSQAPTSASAPITVGFLCDCSGAFGSQGQASYDVFNSWVKTINSAGGIKGHKVQVIFENDSENPGTSATNAQTVISDKVDIIADADDLDATWAQKAEAANIPVIGPTDTSVQFYTNPDFYPEGQTNDSAVYAVAAVAKAADLTNTGIMYCAEVPVCHNYALILKSSGTTLGIPMVYSTSIAATAPNYTAQCVAAQQAHVQGLLVADAASVTVKVSTDCAQQGYNPTYVYQATGYQDSERTSPMGVNLLMEAPILPYFANTPSIRQMNAAVDQYYPGLRANTQVWSSIETWAWPTGILLEDAVSAGGLTPASQPTAAEITTGLEALKGDTLQGWSPPLTFAAGKTHSVSCWFSAQVKNHVATMLDNDKLTCEKGSA